MSSTQMFRVLIDKGNDSGEVIYSDRFLARVSGMDKVMMGSAVVFEDGSNGIVEGIFDDYVEVLNLNTEVINIGSLVVSGDDEIKVKVSNDILEGFLRRYYTINTEVYKQAGIGRGGANRQSLLLYLFKINHILITTKGSGNTALLPIDRLCPYANINDLQIGHRKQNLARVLTSLQLNQFKFQFQFQKGNTQHKFMVKLDFSPVHGQQ